MKLTKILVCGALIGAVAFAASQASAFPLKLVSASGTIYSTSTYNSLQNTNKAHYMTKSFNLQKIMMLVSNTVAYETGTNPPANAYIAWNPYEGGDYAYLTNSSGYYQSLSYSALKNSGYYVEMYLEDMAGSFTGGNNSGSENDKVLFYFEVSGRGPDGYYYDIEADYGSGTLAYHGNSSKVGMTINGNGPGYGENAGSYDGVSTTSIVFSGSAASAEWSGPFVSWWE